VADDHAIARLEIVVERVSPAGDAGGRADASGESVRPRQAGEATIPIVLSPGGAAGWVGSDRLPLEGLAAVQLDGLGLRVGDQVRLIVRAVDYRGAADGQVAESEPVLLDVTDERGILAGLLESDERSLEQLDAIIDRELAVGAAR
jgi:hypothetical protein